MSRENVLYVVAVPEFLTTAHRRTQPGKVLNLSRYYRRLPRVGEVVQAMRQVAGRTGSIDLLSFQCHGFTGGAILWDNERPGGRLLLYAGNVGVMRAFREYMSPRGRVEFHSCNTGSGTRPTMSAVCATDGATAAQANATSMGQLFLQRMANAVERPVTAAVWAQGGRNALDFCGPTVTFEPRLWSE